MALLYKWLKLIEAHTDRRVLEKAQTCVEMEDSILLYSAFSLLIISLVIAIKFLLAPNSRRNIPPSPPAIPIIGHLHLLKPPVHRILQTLSQKYGPIFSLRFGSRLVVIVSSMETAEECFTKNDIVFANRPDFAVSNCLSYNNTTLGAAPYGDHWRKLRRVSALEILSSSRLQMNLGIRRDEIRRLVNKLYQASSHDFAKVELKSMVKELTLNITMRMVAGKRYYSEEAGKSSDEARTFQVLVDELFEFTLSSYPGDFLPILKYIDIQGFMKRARKLIKRVDAFWQGLIDEHRTNKSGNAEMENSMISHFLKLQESQPDYYTDEIIKGLILTMILGGSDTTAVTIEWAMSNLLNHPSVLKKARAEIESQIGKDQLLEESDLSKLSYLKCIILETLRLYPAGPLLLPHRSSADCTLSEYHVPSNTILLVNAWAIHRDPTLWDDPTSFRPERFENGDGEAQKLVISFGLGRRACPGSGMAHRVLGLTLGTFIQCFEWERIEGKEIDMAEGKGVSMPKAQPLEALCRARHVASTAISSSF